MTFPFTKFAFVLLVFNFGAFYSFGQPPDFSGTWKLDFGKSNLESKSEGLTSSIFLIEQNGDDFRLTRYHIFGEKKKKISFKMIADGKTRTVKILFKGKLEKTADGLKATLWRKNFSNIVDYKFGASHDELIADEVFENGAQKHHNIWVFIRESPIKDSSILKK